jgi:hypothetical protein
MTTVLARLGLAFAALAVWLTVRIINRRERWAKRTAVALTVVLLGYPLSFGPACWIIDRWEHGDINRNSVRFTAKVYAPFVQMAYEGPQWISGPIFWWTSIGAKDPEFPWTLVMYMHLPSDPP